MTALFALVKWVSGEDNGKFTVGVPTDWILDFSYEDFKNDTYDPDISYVIEWRRGKQPVGGWKVYDGLVTEVSSSIAVLEKKFHSKYNGEKAPKIITASAEDAGASSTRSFLKTPNHFHQNETLQQPNQSFNAGEDDVGSLILNQLRGMREDLDKQNRKRKRNDSYSSDSNDENNPDEFEVGRYGSGIKITGRQWECAKSQPTCTAMATTLLTALVPTDVLLRSNCKGGKPKITKNPCNVVQHEAIQQDILNAIEYRCQKRFKKTYNATRIHSAINAKINALRSKASRDVENNCNQDQ